MADAYKDSNNVSTLIAVNSSNGTGIVRVLANPTNHGLEVSDGTTGSDNGPTGRALRDSNNVPTLLAVSSADGQTPVAVYSDSSGNLLVKST